MQSDILFDNILIADDLSTVLQWTAQTYVFFCLYILVVDRL